MRDCSVSATTTGVQLILRSMCKGSVCFILKFTLPPFSPRSPQECKFQNKTGTGPLTQGLTPSPCTTHPLPPPPTKKVGQWTLLQQGGRLNDHQWAIAATVQLSNEIFQPNIYINAISSTNVFTGVQRQSIYDNWSGKNEVNSRMNLARAFYSDPHFEEKNKVNYKMKMTLTVECY